MPFRLSSLSPHHATIFLLVFLEYLQSVMVSFSSSYISGGVSAAPEEFSLAAACYATVAVVVILSHRWLVQQLGYRALLRLSLLLFAVGAVLCARCDSVGGLIIGRMVQACGGAAFFTASRVQVLHYQGKERLLALLSMPMGITLGSALAPVLAAYLIGHFNWRAIFWVMLPLTFLVDRVVAHAVPESEPVENEQPDQLHPWSILLLTLGVFMLLFVLERARFDLFDHELSLLTATVVAIGFLLVYLRHEWRRPARLITYEDFSSNRYWLGLCLYFFGYVVVSANNYILPLFLVQGLGFAVQSTGWALGLSGLISVLVVPLQMWVMMKKPFLKPHVLTGLLSLGCFGWLASRFSQDVTLVNVGAVLMLLNGVFMSMILGAAAAGTFRGIQDKVFTHAYQVKNSMREIANAIGVSLATILVQMRSTLHFNRLAESTGSVFPLYGNAGAEADPWNLLQAPGQAVLQRLSLEMTRQSVLMACQDFFWLLCLVGLLGAGWMFVQRRLV
jgi:DHA2 family multidrug resistance protein